jgi:mannose PTS system EIIA component
MSAILIIAHAPLASALKSCATHVWSVCPAALEALDIAADADVAQSQEAAARVVSALKAQDSSASLLILTDVFGATPCNIAQKFSSPTVRVVTGVNLPMLMRTVCYASEALELLAQRAVTGTTQGVMTLAYTAPQQQTLKTNNDPTGNNHQQ